MTEDKKVTERTYVVPLRRAWVNVPIYKRSRKAVVALKIFIAKHMHVPDRDVSKVKLDVYLNNDIWFKGSGKPPSKVKVKAIKEGDIVRVVFFDTPERVKYLKSRHASANKEADKPAKTQDKKEEPKEQTEEQKKDEVEKEKAVEQQNIKQAESQANAQKHTSKIKEPKINRMAMKK